ncbi:hypothetical protein [Solitalea koreensis]|uniref:Uncharacterized protein n=1 Tax=Solitalea koreensis TaxID=543615 RepID=A0A521DYN7_9SPHI|nr:hypothetical protein [Solitalea koreensis]SMO76000.1 hypothetical protein SAMN06265350_10915 [Solitalea koreensis]
MENIQFEENHHTLAPNLIIELDLVFMNGKYYPRGKGIENQNSGGRIRIANPEE